MNDELDLSKVGYALLLVFWIFGAYCLVGFMTQSIHKRYDSTEWFQWSPINSMFWPLFWVITLFRVLGFLWNRLLDSTIGYEGYRPMKTKGLSKRAAKRKLEEAKRRLIADKTVDELAKMIDEGRLT
jgi:hypothetical protein